MARYLKKEHSIDPSISTISEKRLREGTAISTAILYRAEINIKAEE